jgi:hypothetical protein
MCFGSPSNDAAEEAQKAEQARLAAIARTQGAINGVFNSPTRAADISDFVGATRDYLTRDLNEQKDTNDRQLRFALARGGMLGGSVQVDKQSDFARDYAKALLSVDQRARGAGAELESADQDARARLISLATTGLDATTGAQQSSAAMKSALESARAGSQVQGLGDMFKGFTDWYQQTREAAERRRGWDATGLSLYQPNANFTAGKP